MQLRYLLVDDSPSIRLSLAHILQQVGVPPDAIETAASVSEALDRFHSRPPDVVFVDVELSGPDEPHSPGRGGDPMLAANPGLRESDDSAEGVGLSRQLLAENPALKLIVCTGLDANGPEVRRLVREGAFEVVAKPLRLARVREVVRLIEEEGQDPGRPS
ncbi:MAG: response regulator [Thermoplasmata archaeon]|nr:response regulator [Thermoplasmata archaeon]